MREILGRLGDGFYWGGCLGVIWAVGYTLHHRRTPTFNLSVPNFLGEPQHHHAVARRVE